MSFNQDEVNQLQQLQRVLRFNQEEVHQLKWLRDILETSCFELKSGNEFTDPTPTYFAVPITFYNSELSSREFVDYLFTEVINQDYVDFLYTPITRKNIARQIGKAISSMEITGNVRLFSFPILFNANRLALPDNSAIKPMLLEDVRSINNTLIRRLNEYRLSFKTNKDHQQFTATYSLLSEISKDKVSLTRYINAFKVIGDIIEQNEIEQVDWLIPFNTFFMDFIDCYVRDPNEMTKVFFAYQTTYGINEQHRFVDIPFVHNRVYGKFLKYLLQNAPMMEVDFSIAKDWLKYLVNERLKTKQRYHN